VLDGELRDERARWGERERLLVRLLAGLLAGFLVGLLVL